VETPQPEASSDSIAPGDTTRASSTTGSAVVIGFWAAILTVVDAALFAAVGIATPARSGPLCATWGCIPAPYTDVAQFIPGDYLWLIPGILLAPIFVMLLASIHAWAPEPQKIFSHIGLAFAVGYAVVIGVD
jgi:hypothetical protein